MFRVPQDTVLRRAAATGLLLLTTGLAACGSDSTQTGSISSTSPTSPAVAAPPAAVESTPTTPVSAAEQKKLDKAAAADQAAAVAEAEKKVSKNLPQVTDSPETDQTVADASPKKKSKKTVKGDMKSAQDALEKAGKKANEVEVSGGADGAIQIQNTTVVFFSSDKKAASSTKTFALALAANPDFGKIARTDNRVYLETTTQKLTPTDVAAFNEVRKIVDDAL